MPQDFCYDPYDEAAVWQWVASHTTDNSRVGSAAALQSLPPPYLEVILLRDFGALSIAEIAARLQLAAPHTHVDAGAPAGVRVVPHGAEPSLTTRYNALTLSRLPMARDPRDGPPEALAIPATHVSKPNRLLESTHPRPESTASQHSRCIALGLQRIYPAEIAKCT